MRLDHLLSKEHTPRQPASVRLRMVVFTSGIVDEEQLVRCSWPQYYLVLVVPPCGGWLVVGVEPGCGWWGVVLAHCWALRDQVTGCSRPPGTLVSTVGGGRAWVGVLFVNWIVDASIFRYRV